MSSNEKILISANVLLYGFLTIFSFAYVDLNLTLSKNPQILAFVKTMQQLGYFHRPTATLIYLLLIISAFSFFIINLWLFYKSEVGLNYLKTSVIINTLILIFAYPFLSSDLFNYLFDAKIILKYHASPYTHRPLDFPTDEWLRFMRWVHRYSPYGPLWLTSSLIPAFLGFNKFILNFFTFKIFIGLFHLINAYLVYKILQKINPKLSLFGTAFYGLNPLFLIEGVVNAHNDVIITTSLLAAVYFLIIKRSLLSVSALVLGALVKYISIIVLPLVLVQITFKKVIKIENTILLILLSMGLFTFFFSSFRITVPFVSSGATQVQFQPWYLFWTIPLIALLRYRQMIVLAVFLSFGALLRYVPFLLYGDWSHPGTTSFMTLVTFIPLILSLTIVLLRRKFNS